MLSAVPGNPSRKDLSPLGDEVVQSFYVLIINPHPAIRTEYANFPSLERSFSLNWRFHFSSPPRKPLVPLLPSLARERAKSVQ